MPENPVQLHVWLRGFNKDEEIIGPYRSEEEKEIEKILQDCGFFVFEIWEPSDGRQINTYPFEERKENIQLINDLKEKFQQEFPASVVTLTDEGSLGHPGRDLPAKKFYMITVDNRTDNMEETSDSHSRATSPVEDGKPGDGPEWKAFDSRSGETESETDT